MKITKALATKCLETVDAGLSSGLGNPKPGEMCVEAAICYALGLPHGDDPGCVSGAVRVLKIKLNDSAWSSNAARAKGMRRLALAQLGSKDKIDDVEFAKRVSLLVIRVNVPLALRNAAKHFKGAHHDALLKAALDCENNPAAESAWSAARSAESAAESAARSAAWSAAESAARSAAWSAAESAESAARSAARSAESAESAAWSAARSAAESSAESAESAAWSAESAESARDEIFSAFAEGVVQILIELKAPGAKWLSLTEEVV